MKLEDILNGSGVLSDKEVRFLESINYQLTQDTPDRIKYDLRVINFNLNDDKGLKQIAHIYSNADQATYSTSQSVKELHNKLIQLGKKNLSIYWKWSYALTRINPEFAFYTDKNGQKDSLIEDYNLREKAFNWNCSKDQKERLYDALIKENFVLSSETRLTPIQDSQFLFASLKNNFNATMEFLKKYDNMPLVFLNEEEMEHFYTILKKHGIKDKIKVEAEEEFVEEIKNNVKDGMIGTLVSIDWGYEEDYVTQEIYDNYLKILNYFGDTPTFVSDAFIKNPYVFEKLVSNPKEREFIEEVMWSRKNYTKDDEERLLTLLGSNENNIESVIGKCVKDNLKRSDLSILEIYAIGFYQKKYLNTQGLNDVLVNCFEYSSSSDGAWLDRTKTSWIYNNPGSTIENMLNTILHESAHALQNHHITNIDFSLDEDIDIYSKDIMLGEMLSRESNQYYYENYKAITYEFDAEFKADIEKKNIFGHEENIFDPVFEKLQISQHNNYLINLMRIYESKKYNIHELTEKIVKEYVISEEQIKNFPLLDYEYVLNKDGNEKNPHQKSMDELCKCFVSAKDSKDKNIYRYLISRRLNSRVYENYQQNIIELEELSKSEYVEIKDEISMILKQHQEEEEKFDKSNVEIKNYEEAGNFEFSKQLTINELKEKIKIYSVKADKTLADIAFKTKMKDILLHFQYAFDKIEKTKGCE